MASRICKHCDCTEIDVDQARGDAVCTNCGSVLEDNFIVSEVQFEENARGGSSSIGQFVSLDGGSQRGFASGLHFGYGQESRQVTLDNGRKKIVEVAQQLRLNQHCIDTAFNFFKMAVHRRLTRGRRHCNVIAACLYIVCRLEATSHMLLDFCDVLQVNVYELGKTYLKLSRALCINIPAIDPCLYIIRFAHLLQFGDKTHEVSMTALRLVQRMKRDWMHTGRRPSGLCGAALLVAARLHEFNRTMGDIIKVVKVCTATLRKRLTEFGETPSSRLTLEEFMTIDLEEEQDPPAFKAARKKARIQQLEDQNKVEDATTEITELQKKIERLLEEKNNKLKGMYTQFSPASKDASPQEKAPDETTDSALKFVEDETIETITKFINGNENASDGSIAEEGVTVANDGVNETKGDNVIPYTSPRPNLGSNGLSSFNWRSPIRGVGPTAASLGIKDSLHDCLTAESEPAANENGELDLTGLDDEELDCYIMSADEVKRKSELWHTLNAEYLKELKEKEEREAKEKEEGVVKPEKKKRKVRKKNPIQANSAGEAIEMMLQEKRISNKINYDVLKNLNIQFGTPLKQNVSQLSQGTAGSSTPKTVSFSLPVSDTLNRIQDLPPTVDKPQNTCKRLREDDVPKTPVEQQPTQEAIPDVVIESGPVAYEPAESKDLEIDADYDEGDYYDDDDDDKDPQSGASYLLRHIRGEVADDDDYGDDYYE